jgi:hypothetical protein
MVLFHVGLWFAEYTVLMDIYFVGKMEKVSDGTHLIVLPTD